MKVARIVNSNQISHQAVQLKVERWKSQLKDVKKLSSSLLFYFKKAALPSAFSGLMRFLASVCFLTAELKSVQFE